VFSALGDDERLVGLKESHDSSHAVEALVSRLEPQRNSMKSRLLTASLSACRIRVVRRQRRYCSRVGSFGAERNRTRFGAVAIQNIGP
jgi:hypothetical protein